MEGIPDLPRVGEQFESIGSGFHVRATATRLDAEAHVQAQFHPDRRWSGPRLSESTRRRCAPHAPFPPPCGAVYD